MGTQSDHPQTQPEGNPWLGIWKRLSGRHRWLGWVSGGIVLLAGLSLLVSQLVQGPKALQEVFGWFEGPSPTPDPVKVVSKVWPPQLENLGSTSLKLAVNGSDYVGPDGFGYIVPRDIAEIGRPPADQPSEWSQWAYDMGGVDAPATHVRVALQGTAAQPVLIEDIRAVIVGRQPLPSGTLIKGQTGGCGVLDQHELRIDLDAQPPSVALSNPAAGEALPFVMRPGDFEVFDVYALADEFLYRWRLEIDITVGGSSETISVPEGTGTFVTSGRGSGPHFEWMQPYDPQTGELGPAKWVRSGPPC